MVAVARGGKVERFQAWGQDGYVPDAPFRIASCTKSFTALALLILRRHGKLGLDDELVQHLPEFVALGQPDWPAVRLRHLLSMSAGLATDNPWGDRQESVSRRQLSDWLRGGLRLLFAPGNSFEYSNLGYALLGEVITRASGQEYREYVRDQILEPLGLTRTRFDAAELPVAVQGYHRHPLLPGQAGGWSRQAQPGPGGFSPIGGLYSTANDLAAWADLHLSRQVPAGAAFTAADLLEGQQPLQLIGSQPAPAPLSGLVTGGYGYGLRVEQYDRHGTLVSHAGGYPGFTAYMCWHDRSGYAVLASANGSHSAAPQLARQVMHGLMAAESPQAQPSPAWPETEAAVKTATELVRAAAKDDGPEAVADRFRQAFAENAQPDFPLERRVAYLQQALASLGPVATDGPAKEPQHERPCRASWQLAAQFGHLELFVELMPVAPFLMQTFSAVAVSGGSRVKLF